MVPNNEKLIEVFIDGLPRSIKGNVIDLKPQTLEEAINIAQRKEKLYDKFSKFSKCDFWIRTVQFLSHLFDSQGLHVDPAKIEAGEDQEMAFQILKQKLYEAPILALPEGNGDFVVYCDASILEALKEENVQAENLRGMEKAFEIHTDGTHCIKNRSWLPLFEILEMLVWILGSKSMERAFILHQPDGVGSKKYHVVPYGEFDGIPVVFVARFGVISKSMDRILVSHGG
nr:reverse transcriptase domain-containing protein [Tanacetum cinerariifolium]